MKLFKAREIICGSDQRKGNVFRGNGYAFPFMVKSMTEMNQQLSLFDILEDTPREINKMGKQVIKGVVDPGAVLPPD